MKFKDREHSLRFLVVRAVIVIVIAAAVLLGLRYAGGGTLKDVPVEIVEQEMT